MTIDEINRCLAVGSSKSVCVGLSNCERYPWLVREVSILAPAKVLLEFSDWGTDEGGLALTIDFESIADAVCSLEAYLENGIEAWINYSKDGCYPSRPSMPRTEEGWIKLVSDLKSGLIDLPENGRRYSINSGYWSMRIGE